MKYLLTLLMMMFCSIDAYSIDSEIISTSIIGEISTSGVKENIIDNNFNTSYYARSANNRSVTMTSTITYPTSVHVSSIRIKLRYVLRAVGGSDGASGNLKLYDKNDNLIDTIDSFSINGTGSIDQTRDNTYTTTWERVKYVVLSTTAFGGGSCGGEGSLYQYEVESIYSNKGNYIISFL